MRVDIDPRSSAHIFLVSAFESGLLFQRCRFCVARRNTGRNRRLQNVFELHARLPSEADAVATTETHVCSGWAVMLSASWAIKSKVFDSHRRWSFVQRTTSDVRVARQGCPPLSGVITSWRWVTPSPVTAHSSRSNVVPGGLNVYSCRRSSW